MSDNSEIANYLVKPVLKKVITTLGINIFFIISLSLFRAIEVLLNNDPMSFGSIRSVFSLIMVILFFLNILFFIDMFSTISENINRLKSTFKIPYFLWGLVVFIPLIGYFFLPFLLRSLYKQHGFKGWWIPLTYFTLSIAYNVISGSLTESEFNVGTIFVVGITIFLYGFIIYYPLLRIGFKTKRYLNKEISELIVNKS